MFLNAHKPVVLFQRFGFNFNNSYLSYGATAMLDKFPLTSITFRVTSESLPATDLECSADDPASSQKSMPDTQS